MEFFKSKIGPLEVICSLFCLTMITSTLLFRSNSKPVTDSTSTLYTTEMYQEHTELRYYTAKNKLSDAIDEYIQQVAPASTMNGLAFIKQCDKYDVDIRFVLAQAQLESCFATTGLGGKMNSAFNIGAFDGEGSKYMKKHKHPDLSIEDFLKLLTTKYLTDGKTETDLLNNYVDNYNHRYASNPEYETILFDIYTSICSSPITAVYNDYKKYKILADK